MTEVCDVCWPSANGSTFSRLFTRCQACFSSGSATALTGAQSCLSSALPVQNNASNPTITNLNYTNLAFPGPAAYPFYSASQSNMCNVYLPNDSTLSR